MEEHPVMLMVGFCPLWAHSVADYNLYLYSSCECEYISLCYIYSLEHGEVHSGPAVAGTPLKLTRIPGIQNAKAVFTDFKANNFAYLQKVYRYECVILLSKSSYPSIAPIIQSRRFTPCVMAACVCAPYTCSPSYSALNHWKAALKTVTIGSKVWDRALAKHAG